MNAPTSPSAPNPSSVKAAAASYTSATSSTPLIGETIGDLFDRIASEYATNDALVSMHQGIRWSYRELQQQVERCARALMAIGVEKGDRVGIWSPNNAQWCVTQFATAKIGAVLVNINPAYRLHELEYALNQSECRFLIAADQFKSSDYTAMLNKLVPELAQSAPGKLITPALPHLNGVITLSDTPAAGFMSWQQMLDQADNSSVDALQERQSELQFDDPINIQYTSGTTGFPKGATLSHHNILNNGFFVTESQRFTDQDRLVIPVPLYHCFGMVMGNLGCVSHGATMIYPSEAFEPDSVLKAVAEERATALYGVPTMFIAVLEHPTFADYNLDSLRTGVMAGATCPVEVMKQVIEQLHMKEVQIAYGMTETSPVSTQTGAEDPIDKRVSTVGRTQPHLESKIIDSLGKIVPRGEIGELCTRGYSVMLGYWNNEEATLNAIDSAGWMHTGDLATMDDEGYISIIGRSKDMVIRGGENIYPREIEEFLYTHPAISDAQVTGVPDKKFGEELVAWIILKPEADLTEQELRDYCKDKISHFKVPRYIKFTDAFPMTVTGKIQKFKMREITIDELGLDS
ncbi:AMP-binding protein [Motiliproteus coralliicola]|uniref:AMP-binding protein n=1 Tax=Motiliproteus coralliicola TaxID=2283196 RepID=A0A369WUV0_9GAMM|nr:AMP-binding protein [Motiliproteus coralliicola]RDE24334.1 AMP-binding protein [Motiliproteus coralliicola]